MCSDARREIDNLHEQLAEMRRRMFAVIEGPRPSVMRLARRMEAKLRKRDDRNDWTTTDATIIRRWIDAELAEFDEAFAELRRSRQMMLMPDGSHAIEEATDVANCVMMLCDVVEGVKNEKRGRSGR
jgi:NTP pyrophosphatase (non-canonical NTP hydrolase)